MKLSVIIPVYNVAQYVARCLDSVMAQTYTEVECIIVDDCGSDNSMELIEGKLASYEGPIDFKIVHHEKNRGLSAARNTGTAAATGEYVYYLDSDDLILPDTLSLLTEPLELERVDFVIGNYASGGKRAVFLPLALNSGVIRSNQEVLGAYLDRAWYMMAWNKLVRRDFIQDMGLAFLEGVLHEDQLWSLKLACTAQSMAVVNQITYVYGVRDSSIITTPSWKRIDSWIRIVAEAESCVLDYGLSGNERIVALLVRWRELLVQYAFVFGKKKAFSVYCEHVRKKPFANLNKRMLKRSDRVGYMHHYLPAKLGFWYVRQGMKIPLKIMTIFCKVARR